MVVVLEHEKKGLFSKKIFERLPYNQHLKLKNKLKVNYIKIQLNK